MSHIIYFIPYSMTQPLPTRTSGTRVEFLQKVFIIALKQQEAFSTSFVFKNHEMGHVEAFVVWWVYCWSQLR